MIAVAADLTEPPAARRCSRPAPSPTSSCSTTAVRSRARFDEVTDDDFEVALDLHYRAPIALVRAVLPGMRARKWGRIVAITSAMVTSPNEGMITSVGARAGLTGVLKSLSFAAAADGVTINQLLPGAVRHAAPGRQRQPHGSSATGVTFEEAWAAQAATIAAKRHGDPSRVRRDVRVHLQRARGLRVRHEHPPRRWAATGGSSDAHDATRRRRPSSG